MKKALYSKQSMIVLMYKEVYLNIIKFIYLVSFFSLLQEFEDLFMEDVSYSLLSIKE